MLKSKILVLVVLILLILACENRKEKEILSKKNADYLLHSTKVDTVKLKLPVEEKQPTEDEEYYYKKAHKLWYNEKTYQAISELKEFIKKYPKSSLADDAQKLLGTAYSNVYEFEKSISAYKKVIEKYPNSNSVSTSFYCLAHLYFYELKDLKKAKCNYKQFINIATENNRQLYDIAKTKLKGWPNETNKPEDFEKIIQEKKNIDQEENPTKYLEIIKDYWRKDEYGYVSFLDISIKNNAKIDYKDLVIKIKYYAESGTFLSKKTQTIYKIFPTGKIITINDLNLGRVQYGAEFGVVSIVGAILYKN